MSLYSNDFASLNAALFTRRKRALEVIYNYLEQDDLDNLLKFYVSPAVQEALLPLELEFLRGIARQHFGPTATKDAVEKKPAH